MKNDKYINMPSWFYPKRLSVWAVKWGLYFAVLYIFLWIPTPLTYTEEIHIGPLGVPLFVWGWIIVNVLTICGIFVLYQQAQANGFFEDEYKEEE